MIISSSRLGNSHAIKDRRRGNELDLWILLLECLEESGEPILLVILEAGRAATQPVLVANLHIPDLPGTCVAENGGANATPVCGGVASEEFELIESALDGLVYAIFRELAAVESKATPDSENWSIMSVFAKF